jgi:hypothetical protein
MTLYSNDSDSSSSSSNSRSSSSRVHNRRGTAQQLHYTAAIDDVDANDDVWNDTTTDSSTTQELALDTPQLSPLHYSNTHSIAAITDEQQHSVHPS